MPEHVEDVVYLLSYLYRKQAKIILSHRQHVIISAGCAKETSQKVTLIEARLEPIMLLLCF